MIHAVSEFMQVMGQEMPPVPTVPSTAIQQLRFGLIDEENKELLDAASASDLVEIADALCDLQYVVSGAVRAYGFSPSLFEELFNEVQRSNMSKVCNSHEEAYDTMVKYQKEGVITHINDMENGQYTVVRASDHKVMKSINFSEPNLRAILVKCGHISV